MDSLRAAVGDDKLSYLGFSYGRCSAPPTPSSFPTKIRRWCSTARSTEQDYIQGSESQAKGFERAFTNSPIGASRRPTNARSRPDARKAVTDALAAADKNPIKGDEITADLQPESPSRRPAP